MEGKERVTLTGDCGTLCTIVDFYSNLNKSTFKVGYTGRDGSILRVGFSSNSAEGTVKDIYERGRIEVVFSAIANKEGTADAVHAELFLDLALGSL